MKALMRIDKEKDVCQDCRKSKAVVFPYSDGKTAEWNVHIMYVIK